jgi:hypothetical protein
MKKLTILGAVLTVIGFSNCGNNTKLTQQEEVSIEEQMERDQAAIDSLEKAIQLQLDSSDFDAPATNE